MVRVAVVQVETDAVESVLDRIERVTAAVDDIAAGGDGGLDVCAADDVDLGTPPDVIVLPELWTVGAFDQAMLQAHPERHDGSTIDGFRAIAAGRKVWIHAGAFPIVGGNGRFANVSVVIAPDGSVVDYAKVHLFGFDAGEAALLEAGAAPVVVDSPMGLAGLSTCYDLRFPELYRALADAGAEAFVIPAGWPERRIEHWQVLLRARAIENQAWVIAANGVGEHAGVRLGGRSAIVDPWGNVIVEALPDRECLVIADIDPAVVATTRSSFPVLRDRVM